MHHVGLQQIVGQATSSAMSDADQALYNQMMTAGTSSSDAAASYAPTATPTVVPGTSLSPTTLVIGGIVAIGLIWFLTSK